ncbi:MULTISPECIES: SPOR domain-containing protein [Ramlibacter]|uniref:SPOR domain-containing protein n=1 Tax=Ramlibacter aquaticus TaxID=2780094 RepID=A0ABR9SDY1_9BURK|nr:MULTISPECIES: SPOR domain-containing protein [Ramlibacter]MBE7940424.1 SPOR domain-containing protein [Ramlibacter aquaticus]
MKSRQRGNTIVGIIIGVVLGLAAALAVAVYVTKVPVPFLNKGQSRSPEQDAAESRKNKDWDPNAPLYGKNPARPASAAAAPVAPAVPGAVVTAPPQQPAASPAPPAVSPDKLPPAVAGRPSADPLGELAMAKAASSDPFIYFVQAGAFRTPEDAEAQRAKLNLMGIEAKVSEREQSGRQVWRVRVGPFEKKDDADRQKQKLDAGGFETALVRVQR